jgi:hypothetical protein
MLAGPILRFKPIFGFYQSGCFQSSPFVANNLHSGLTMPTAPFAATFIWRAITLHGRVVSEPQLRLSSPLLITLLGWVLRSRIFHGWKRKHSGIDWDGWLIFQDVSSQVPGFNWILVYQV